MCSSQGSEQSPALPWTGFPGVLHASESLELSRGSTFSEGLKGIEPSQVKPNCASFRGAATSDSAAVVEASPLIFGPKLPIQEETNFLGGDNLDPGTLLLPRKKVEGFLMVGVPRPRM